MLRLTGYGIIVDGTSHADPAAYEAKVLQLLNHMTLHNAGEALLWGISTHGLRVTITPYLQTGCNAGGGGSPGKGYVNFSAETFKYGIQNCNEAGSAGADAREILFHELVHALRGIAGKWRFDDQGRNFRSGGLRANYTSDEEFIALMLTNIYSSQRGRPLRKDHTTGSGFVSLAQTSADTLKSAAKIQLIEVVKRDHPEMFRRIASSGTRYNPLRDYEALPDL